MGRSRVLGGTAAAKPTAQISDDMLVRADVAQKARVQTATFVEQVLLKRLSKERASWGLPISTDMPPLIYFENREGRAGRQCRASISLIGRSPRQAAFPYH